MTFPLFKPSLRLAPSTPDREADIFVSADMVAPTLWVMATKVGFRPNTPFIVGSVPRKDEHCAFRDEVLRVAGIDPANPLTHDTSGRLRPLKGSGTPLSLYRMINHAFQFYEEKLLLQRPVDNRLPFYRGSISDGWCLTEYGVAVATSVHTHFNVPVTMVDPKTGKEISKTRFGNVTSIWLDAKCREGLIDKMVDRLSNDPELGIERTTDHILDHIQTFLAASIRTDAFASWIARGDSPRIGQLCSWAKRKAISEFRKRSRDAHGRERYGALTSRERTEGGPVASTFIVSEYEVVMTGDDSEGGSLDENRVIVDPHSAQIMEHLVQGENGMARVYDAIRRMKAGNPERFVTLFDLMAKQHSVAEIGEELGVTRNRAANLMASLRMALREAECESRESRLIITYLRDEPHATVEDILEDIDGLESDVPKLLTDLVNRGRLAEHNGSYTTTESGLHFLPLPSSDDFGARLAL